MPRVKKITETPEAEDVFIGRPSKWGNPFKVGRDGLRHEVVERYKEYLLKDRPDLVRDAKLQLRGKNLVCYCAPKQCHGDILLEIANG